MMKLFVGQQWRCRHREQDYRPGEQDMEKLGQMARAAWKRALPSAKQRASGI